MTRRGTVAAIALSAAVTASASAIGAADARAGRSSGPPAYCKPIKRAFSGLTTTDPNDFKAYNRAYGTAAKLLRKAAKSAPKDVAESLRHVSERFHEVVKEDVTLEVADIHRLGPDVTTISGVVEQLCGFNIDGAPPST